MTLRSIVCAVAAAAALSGCVVDELDTSSEAQELAPIGSDPAREVPDEFAWPCHARGSMQRSRQRTAPRQVVADTATSAAATPQVATRVAATKDPTTRRVATSCRER